MTWWYQVHPSNLGQDEDDKEDKNPTNKGSSDDDPYQVNNSMHDIPMHGEEEKMLILEDLAKVVPLMALGKNNNP